MSEKFTGEDLKAYLDDIRAANLKEVTWTCNVEIESHWDISNCLFYNFSDGTILDMRTGNYILPEMVEYYKTKPTIAPKGKRFIIGTKEFDVTE